MTITLICIAVGASAGAILRWVLGLALNAALPAIPLGTLTANLTGGYLMGIAFGVFSAGNAFPSAIGTSQALHRLIITGFLGGLTIFSAFTAEVGTLLQGGRFPAAAAIAGLYVGGSVVMLFLGMGNILPCSNSFSSLIAILRTTIMPLHAMQSNGRKHTMSIEHVTESSGNVFRDLGFSEEEARESLAKAKLVIIIQQAMESAGWTQEETAKRIGVKQPRLSTLLRGDYRNISESKLLDCVMKLGCDVKITIKRRSPKAMKTRRHGQLQVVGA